MGESCRNEKHLFLLTVQRHANILPISFASRPHVYRNVIHSSSRNPYKFSLGMLLLKMQASQNTFTATALIILNESSRNSMCREIRSFERLGKISATVAEHLRSDYIHTRNLLLLKYKCHTNNHAGAAPAQIGMKTGRRKIARFLVKSA